MAGFGFLGVTSTQRSSVVLTAEGSMTVEGTRHPTHRFGEVSTSAESTFVTTVSPSLLREVRQDSPVVLWRLNETSGTVALDSSGNGNHGTYEGSPTLASGSVVTEGHDLAPYFGTGQRVIGDNLITLNNPYTIEGWFYRRPSSTGTFSNALIGDADYFGNEGGEIGLYIPAGGVNQLIQGRFDNEGEFNGPYYVTTRQSMHVVVVADATTTKLYVNGDLVESVNYTANDWTSFYPSVNHLAGNFGGYVAWVAYYDTALSAARVLAHFEAEPLLTGSYLTATSSQTVSGNALHRSGAASLTATSDAIVGAPHLLATVVDTGPSLAIPVEARVAGTLAIIVANHGGTLNWDDIDGGPSAVGLKWYERWAILDGTETTIELDAGFTSDFVVMFWENAELSWNKYGVTGITRANSIPTGIGFTRDEVDPWSTTIARLDKSGATIAFDEVGYTTVASATGWAVGLQKYVVFDSDPERPDIKAGFPSVMIERNGEDATYDLTTWTVRPRRAYDQYMRDMDPTFWSFPNKATTVQPGSPYGGLVASYESFEGPSPVDETVPTLGRRFSWKSGGPRHYGFSGALATDAFASTDWSFTALMKRRPIEDLSQPWHQQYTIVATHATAPETSVRLIADFADEANLLTIMTSEGGFDVVEGFVDDGEWHLYVVTFDSPSYTLKIFIDGREVLSQVLVSPVSGPQGMWFGTDDDSEAINSFYYNEVTFFNRLVTPAEIDDLVEILGVQRTPVLRSATASLTATGSMYAKSDLLTTVLNDNPTILWRLNETSGTVATDSSGNGLNGTYIGSPSLAASSVVTSFDDKAPYFGDGAYVIADDSQTFSVPFTMECWANTPYDYVGAFPGDTESTIMGGDDTGTSEGAVLRIISGFVQARVGITTPSNVSLDWGGIIRHQPHHYVLVCGTSEIELYVDGELRDSYSATPTGYSTPFYPRVGSDALNGDNYFGGYAGWVAWYDHALDADHIYAHFRAGPIPGRSHQSASTSQTASGFAGHYGAASLTADSGAMVGAPKFIDIAWGSAYSITIPVAARVAGTLAIVMDSNADSIDGGGSAVDGKWMGMSQNWFDRSHAILDGTETTITTGDSVACAFFYSNAEMSLTSERYNGSLPESDWFMEEFARMGFYLDSAGTGFANASFSSNMTENEYSSFKTAAAQNVPSVGSFSEFSYGFATIPVTPTGDPFSEYHVVRPTCTYDQYVRSLDPVFWMEPHKSTHTYGGSYNPIIASAQSTTAYSPAGGPTKVTDKLPDLTTPWAWECNGSWYRINASYHPDFVDATDWSIGFFAKNPSSADTSTNYCIMSSDADITAPFTQANGQISIEANRTADEQLSFVIDSVAIDVSGGFPADDTWHFYYFDYRNSDKRMRVYVDGSLGGTDNASSHPTQTDFYFGSFEEGTFRFQEIMIYDRLLTTTGGSAEVTLIQTHSGI